MPVAPTFDQPAMAQPVQIARDGLWRQRSYPEKGHPAFPPPSSNYSTITRQRVLPNIFRTWAAFRTKPRSFFLDLLSVIILFISGQSGIRPRG